MATTLRYLGVRGEGELVQAWFIARQPQPSIIDVGRGMTIWYPDQGALATDNAGGVDVGHSPLVSHIPPRQARGVLWTAGEVHFLPQRMREAFPELDKVRAAFKAWLAQFDLVFAGKTGAWDYFLEGSIRNYDAPVYALPGAMAALRAGATYFVNDQDGEDYLDRICRELRLRGINCIE